VIIYKCAKCGNKIDTYTMTDTFGAPAIGITRCPFCGHKFKYKIARVEIKPKQAE